MRETDARRTPSIWAGNFWVSGDLFALTLSAVTSSHRAARCLLMTADRVDDERFPLTQEFLAQMLGVRRATVSLTAGLLQTVGLIRYRRGVITITDRAGLEDASCDCYRIVRDEFDQLAAAQ